MKTLITGTSQGIGKAIADLFLENGHEVIGIDRNVSTITHNKYVHYEHDVRDIDSLPEFDGIQIMINNAGTQNEDDIDINLKALIRITENTAFRKTSEQFLISVPQADIPAQNSLNIVQARAESLHIQRMSHKELPNMALHAIVWTQAESSRH